MNISNDNSLQVYINEKEAGVLTVEANKYTFQYTSYNIAPLSVNMPVQATPYENRVVKTYFANLLPEGNARQQIAKIVKLPPDDDFILLKAIGRECAGAVSLIPIGDRYDSNHIYKTITEEQLYKIVKELPAMPSIAGDGKVKLSLAGAQSKLALYIDNGVYKLPINGSPSTHIIKKAIDGDICPDSIMNETFVMQLAKEIGLNVPNVEMKIINGLPFFIIERYDRRIEANCITRYVQEDFCQVAKLLPIDKYEPSITDCYDIILQHSVDINSDTRQFLRWIAFNIVIGNHDAHAKNISLLHTYEGVRLAPFYDILSTQVYPVLDNKLAMPINGENHINYLTVNDFKQLANSLDINYKIMSKINNEIARLAYDKGKKLQEKYKNVYSKNVIIDNIVNVIKTNRNVFLDNEQKI